MSRWTGFVNTGQLFVTNLEFRGQTDLALGKQSHSKCRFRESGSPSVTEFRLGLLQSHHHADRSTATALENILAVTSAKL